MQGIQWAYMAKFHIKLKGKYPVSGTHGSKQNPYLLLCPSKDEGHIQTDNFVTQSFWSTQIKYQPSICKYVPAL